MKDGKSVKGMKSLEGVKGEGVHGGSINGKKERKVISRDLKNT